MVWNRILTMHYNQNRGGMNNNTKFILLEEQNKRSLYEEKNIFNKIL